MNAPVSAPAQAELARSERHARQADVVVALSPLLPAHALLWQPEDTGQPGRDDGGCDIVAAVPIRTVSPLPLVLVWP